MTISSAYDLLPQIYGTALSDELWPGVLDQIVEGAGAGGALMRAFDRVLLPFSMDHASSIYARHSHLVPYYLENFGHFDLEAMNFIATLPASQLVLDTDIWGPIDTLQHRDDFVWIRSRAGLFRRVGVRLNACEAWWDSLFFQFDEAHADIPRDSLEFIRILLPHLAKAVELNRFFRVLQSRFRAALAALDRVQVGVAVVLGNGHVLLANREALRILGTGDALRVDRSGCLAARNTDLTDALRNHVARLAQTTQGRDGGAEVTLSVERGPGEAPLLVELSPLKDSRNELGADLSGVLVTLIDPANRPAITTDHLAELYKLTPAELAVCQLLIDGLPLADIADTRKVSPETVKTQAHNVYRKTQTSGRADLIRLVLDINPPIDKADI